MAKPISERALDRQDYAQTIEMAIARGVATWRPELGMPFREYVDQAIHTEVRAMNRSKKRSQPKRGRLVRLDDLRDEPADHHDFTLAMGLADAAGRAMANLTGREREVVILMFQMGYTREQAAEVLKLSPGSVDKIRGKAIASMRRRMIPV